METLQPPAALDKKEAPQGAPGSDADEPSEADDGDVPGAVPLSKNAIKKLARREARAEGHRKAGSPLFPTLKNIASLLIYCIVFVGSADSFY